jgi:hypothetical protein
VMLGSLAPQQVTYILTYLLLQEGKPRAHSVT